MLEVRLLGKFEVKHNKKSIGISSRPAQSLFAYLILNAGTSHRREKLAGLLWSDSLEETARGNLRHALWRIRKSLPSTPKVEYLIADELSVAFNAAAQYWLDAAELENLRENCSADELIAILSNYQGELLAGFYDEWVLLEREHLYSKFEHHMARLMSLLQEEQRWSDILEWGESWIKLGQKPEPAYRALMNAHAANGDMSKVAATYERCKKSLKEFNIEPSEQTKALYEELKSGSMKDAPRLTSSMMRLSTKGTFSNIPVPLTSFIGRQAELHQIARFLASSRLLTLTGPGGVGKTRLAIETAHHFLEKFKDGVFWVGLDAISDESLIPQEIARALSVREVPSEALISTLKNFLRSKDILLVMDNCEHIIRFCAQYAEQLLAACPKLKILATSIEAFGLFNEVIWQVPSLPLPENQPLSIQELQDIASIELFNERAVNAKSSFRLDEKTAPLVAQICCRLDGIPLAIELAAARIRVLSVDEIASRLDDRFSLLTAGSRTAVPRHQTLRATIDWSYELLTEPERTLLRRASVFVGGFSLAAAETVCSPGMKRGDILDLLGRLIDKSLVVVEVDPRVSETRYRLLETIRQYALEKLIEKGEAPTIRDHHLLFFLNMAERAEPDLFGHHSVTWFHQLDQELDNIRAATEWGINSDKAVEALRLSGALVYFWFAHGNLLSEWQHRIQLALNTPHGMERTLARAKALNGLGFMYWADMNFIDRRAELEEALNIATQFRDSWNTATALSYLGLHSTIQGKYAEARFFLEQSLEIWRKMDSSSKSGMSWTLNFLGDVAYNQNQMQEARLIYEENAALLKQLGDKNFLAYSLRRLGLIAWREKDYEQANILCKESLMLNQELGDVRGVLASVVAFATIAFTQGQLERSATLMAAVEEQLKSIGLRLLPIDRMEYERNLASLHVDLNEKTLNRAWSKGRAMLLEDAVSFAMAEP